jgi:hypothetical protein
LLSHCFGDSSLQLIDMAAHAVQADGTLELICACHLHMYHPEVMMQGTMQGTMQVTMQVTMQGAAMQA